MKNKIVVCWLVVGFICGSVSAVQVFDPDYIVKTYVSYSQPAELSRGMTFDSDGNLYVTYSSSGTIDVITPDKNITQLASGMTDPRSVVWAGGSDYDNYLYVADHAGSGVGRIAKVSLAGVVTTFASLNSPQGLGLDRVGTYGGYLYTGPRVSDHIDRILPNGELQLFSDFPYGMPGGPCDFTFDPGIDYGGFMYVGTDSINDVAWRGVHSIDINGNPTRFAPDIVEASQIMFDYGDMFDNKLFIGGRRDSSNPWEIWRAEPDGTTTLFATGTVSSTHTFTFGSDGAMYVHEAANDVVTISRVSLIPEPATILLLSLGGMALMKKRRE
ncbi:MAG: PEP-CTERM sorting domain-containing protein [Sedimentisphaerales bacterium]|nr:PEP-CTERM sorting domain-containing protein [Sedimentisphaerales bacterium]